MSRIFSKNELILFMALKYQILSDRAMILS